MDGVCSKGLHEPIFTGNEKKYLLNCIDSTYVSSVGEYVTKFEQYLRDYTGVKNVIAVVNGTSALHMSLIVAGVERDDEVLIPSLSFVATANAVSYLGAHPHFVESNEESLGIDFDKLYVYLQNSTEFSGGHCINKKTRRRIRAIVPMHTFGHIGDMDACLKLANDYKLIMIEDAAEALGSYQSGKHAGTFGEIGILSFNGNKIITTGSGGAILTNSNELAKKARHISTTAKISHPWLYEHDEIGYNYRMSNINAALGCAQLENIDLFIKAKYEILKEYQNALKQFGYGKLYLASDGNRSNYWLQALILDKKFSIYRDTAIQFSHQLGWNSRPVWKLLHKLKPYQASQAMELAVAEELEGRIINLPSSPTKDFLIKCQKK